MISKETGKPLISKELIQLLVKFIKNIKVIKNYY